MGSKANSNNDLATQVAELRWYHTLDLRNGIITPGIYDHRPFLGYYGIPEDLTGKTVLDIGAANGFFSFELERRGAHVTAADVSNWFDTDLSPQYRRKLEEAANERANFYFHQPFEVAKRALGSKVTKQYISIYDVSPDTVGMFDLVFCGSLLCHLTDPIKALWNIANVTKEKAIIATVIDTPDIGLPMALMIGDPAGDGWWAPTRTCLEVMMACAGFVGIEWISEFQLNYRNQSIGPYHGVLHAYKTVENWTPQTRHRDEILERQQHTTRTRAQGEIERLKAIIGDYERGRFIRFMRWIKGFQKSHQ